MDIKGMLGGKKKGNDAPDDINQDELLENLHRVVASQAPGSYQMLCDAMPLKEKKDN